MPPTSEISEDIAGSNYLCFITPMPLISNAIRFLIPTGCVILLSISHEGPYSTTSPYIGYHFTRWVAPLKTPGKEWCGMNKAAESGF